MQNTKIQWTDETDNVIVVVDDDGNVAGWFCTKESPGCLHCYSETLNQSTYYHGNKMKYRIPANGEYPPMKLRTEILDKWKNQKRPRKHFVNSMTDTFGQFVTDDWIYQIFDAMAAAPTQTFQVLTKRAKRMYTVVMDWLKDRGLTSVPVNIWLGVSAEDQEWFDKRIFWLSQIPAVRFVSFEPLLGPINLGFTTDHIHWAIIGAESGKDARFIDVGDMRSLLQQCQSAGIATFMKQMGTVWAKSTGAKHPKGGDALEWEEDLRVMEFPIIEGEWQNPLQAISI